MYTLDVYFLNLHKLYAIKDFSLEHTVPHLNMSMALDSLTDYKISVKFERPWIRI